MKSFAALAVSALALLPYVSAHGFVNKFVVDGKSYTGNVPNEDTSMSSPNLIATIQMFNFVNRAQRCSPDQLHQPGKRREQPRSQLRA